MQNRERVTGLLNHAKDRQITNFRTAVGDVVKKDVDVVIMPKVRINATKSSYHKSALDFAPANMTRIPIAKYLSTHRKETNLH